MRDFTHTHTHTQVMADVRSLMALLDAGYPCSIRDQLHVHPTSVAAFSLVFKDLRILYQARGVDHSVLLSKP